jgi:thymidine phosphorylase
VLQRKVGDAVQSGETLCTVHYNDERRLGEALELLNASFEIWPAPRPGAPLIQKVIGGVGGQ